MKYLNLKNVTALKQFFSSSLINFLTELKFIKNRYESIFLLLLYAAYIYAMYMNTVLEAWANTLPIPFPVHDPSVLPTEKSGLVVFKSATVDQSQGADTQAYGDMRQSSTDYSAVGKFPIE